MAEWSQKEPPLKLATRDTAANRKPAFWSSKVHGVPQGYKPKSTALALRRPDSAPIMRKANAIVAHGQKVGKGSSSAECDPDRLEEIEDQVRKKIIECTPALQEREQTILIRACSKFDEDGRGFITCEAFQKVLECLDVSATLSECRAVFSKYGQDVRGRMPYKVFANALFTSKNRLLAWTDIQHTVPFQLDDSHKQKLQDAFTGKIQYRKCVTGIYTPTKPGMWDADLIRASRQPPTARLQLEHVYGYTGLSKYEPAVKGSGMVIDPAFSVLSPNLFFTSTQEIVYYTAAVGIVLSYKPADGASTSAGSEPTTLGPQDVQQRFFQSHDDDILCLALDESRNYCATGQTAPPKRGKGWAITPTVSVWDVHSMQELVQLEHEPLVPQASQAKEGMAGTSGGEAEAPFRMTGVQAVAFTEDGSMLLSVCNAYNGKITKTTLHVWEWRLGKQIHCQDLRLGVPPQVYGVVWNNVEIPGEDKPVDFVTFGRKHVDFWKFKGKGANTDNWRQGNGAFRLATNEKKDTEALGCDDKGYFLIQDVLCAQFLPSGTLVTGTASGDLYQWTNRKRKPQGGGSSTSGARPRSASAARSQASAAEHEESVDWRVKRRVRWNDSAGKPRRAHAHSLQVLKLRVKNGKKGGEKGGDPAIYTLLSAGAEGEIKRWRVHEVKIPQQDDKFVLHDKLELLDVIVVPAISSRGPKPAIKAIDTFPGSEHFAVGTDRCDVLLLKPKNKEPDQPAKGKVPPRADAYVDILVKGHQADLDGLDAHPEKPDIFASTCQSGHVYIWDARSKQELGFGSLNGLRASCCAFRACDGKRLAVGTLEGSVAIFKESDDPQNGWSGKLKRLRHAKSEPRPGANPRNPPAICIEDSMQAISELRYSPDRRTLAVASHDQFIWLYNAESDEYERLARCVGHSATVSHIDFSVDSRVLQSVCNAYELLYWRVNRDEPRSLGMQIKSDQRDQEWATWSCTLGFDVMGIWPSGYDRSDINMVARLNDENRRLRYLAAVDDRGGVMLFNYPAVVEKTWHYFYPGHSSHVTNVKWLLPSTEKGSNGEEEKVQYLLTAGGHDRALFQWKLIRDVELEKKRAEAGPKRSKTAEPPQKALPPPSKPALNISNIDNDIADAAPGTSSPVKSPAGGDKK